MSELTKPFIEQVRFVSSMLDDEFDWEANGYPEFEEEFQALINLDAIPSENTDRYYECGSYKPSDTTTCLYRILWLAAPKQVDFSDMYKHTLFDFMSADGQCVVRVYLYKYELALYYYAPKHLMDTSEASPVWGGWAGADNGVRITDPTVQAFIDLVQKSIEYTHMVYGGNDFEV